MPIKILLITPLFYGVEKEIIAILEKSGHEVSWIENKSLPFDYHGTKSKFKLLRKLYFFFFFPQVRYINEELKKLNSLKFDLLFSINGNIICKHLFRKLKKANSGLFSILYLWDSFAMFNWEKELRYFDKVFSFDQSDSVKHKLEYKPNFYVEYISKQIREKKYDIFFTGKFNPFRFSIIEKLINECRQKNVLFYVKLWPGYKFFLHNRIIYSLLKRSMIKGSLISFYITNFEAVEGYLDRDYLLKDNRSFIEIHGVLLSSNVVLDLPFRFQSGYSHNVISALANGRKVITTNSGIVNEVFYNSDQIRIIDIENPQFDYSWIKEESNFPINNYFKDLELSFWIKSIINAKVA
jgi:hypothetical protein